MLAIRKFIVISIIVTCIQLLPFLEVAKVYAKNVVETNYFLVSNPDDEINELDESNITTEIYKSNDQSINLLEDKANTDPTIKSDILNKEELLNGNKSYKQKLSKNNGKVSKISRSFDSIILPWFIAVVLIAALSVVFKIVIKKKVI